MNDKGLVSLEETARILQKTPLNILMHIKRGLLRGVEEDGQWQVEKTSLDALMAKTGGGKGHDVCASGCAPKHACGGGCSSTTGEPWG